MPAANLPPSRSGTIREQVSRAPPSVAGLSCKATFWIVAGGVAQTAKRITVLVAFRDELIEQIPRLRRFAVGLTGDRTRGDDLVQDTLVKAMANEHRFQAGTNLVAWLLKIMRNHFISEVRRIAVRSEVAVNENAAAFGATPASQSDHMELKELERALSTLADEQRMAILLVSLEGLSYEEAAGVMGIPIGTIRSRVSRARQQLRQELERPDRPAKGESEGRRSAGPPGALGV